MLLIDHAPDVIQALCNAGPTKQTDLTEMVFGSSGRGNTGLTKSLFPFVVNKGWATSRKLGRSTEFEVTDLGRSLVGIGDPHANWDFTKHCFKTV